MSQRQESRPPQQYRGKTGLLTHPVFWEYGMAGTIYGGEFGDFYKNYICVPFVLAISLLGIGSKDTLAKAMHVCEAITAGPSAV